MLRNRPNHPHSLKTQKRKWLENPNNLTCLKISYRITRNRRRGLTSKIHIKPKTLGVSRDLQDKTILSSVCNLDSRCQRRNSTMNKIKISKRGRVPPRMTRRKKTLNSRSSKKKSLTSTNTYRPTTTKAYNKTRS